MTAPAVDHEPDSTCLAVHGANVPGARGQNDFVPAVTRDSCSHGVARPGEHQFHSLWQSALRGTPRAEAAD